jgi:hypothetical protein
MVPPSLEFFALFFALFKAGCVPVLVDPGIGLKPLKTCLGEARPEVFIGITKAHIARLVLGWGRGHIKKTITVGPRLGWGGVAYRRLARGRYRQFPAAERPARRSGRDPVHLRIDRHPERRGLPPSPLRRPGRPDSRQLPDAARRSRPADLPAVRPVRPGPGHDHGDPADGLHPSGQRRPGHAGQPDRALPRDQPVRLTGPDEHADPPSRGRPDSPAGPPSACSRPAPRSTRK